MIKKFNTKILILLIITIITIFYLFIHSIIGNDKFKNLKITVRDISTFDSEQIKLIKRYIFPYKVISAQQQQISQFSNIIRTDGNHSFKLNERNNLYFYNNSSKYPNPYDEIEIEVTGVLKDREIQCYKIKTNNSHKIKLSEFSQKCKSAIYFIGKMNKNLFYFGFKQETRNRSKNLLVLPSTAFYLYTNNTFGITPDTINEDYIINLNNIPLNPVDRWASKISQSIHNISNIIKDYEVILDYEFQNFELEDYNLIIFPLHQEYVSNEFIEKFQSFLKKKNKVVLSIGGGNFKRDFELENDVTIKIKKNKYKDVRYYGLNTHDNGFNKNCSYLDDDKIEVGEISEPLINNNIEYFFPKIKCEEGKIIPLLSTQTFDNNSNSKLIHILSDGIGINFAKIKYLKSKIASEIDNILKN